jgi:glycerol kinase
MTYLLALDQGTSSSRSIVFDADGRIVAMAQREFRQIYPQPGWVEHDPEEIWQTQLATAREALARAGITAARRPSASPTSARPRWCGTAAPASPCTTPSSGRTAAPSRCAPSCASRPAADASAKHRLVVDAYFSATKLRWILDHVPGAHAPRRAASWPSARWTAGCCGS